MLHGQSLPDVGFLIAVLGGQAALTVALVFLMLDGRIAHRPWLGDESLAHDDG